MNIPAGMKAVPWEDANGHKYMMLIPAAAPEAHASRGIRVGPPDLSPLGLPPELARELNNQLFARGLFEKRDYVRHMADVNNALRVVFRVSVHRIVDLFDIDETTP